MQTFGNAKLNQPTIEPELRKRELLFFPKPVTAVPNQCNAFDCSADGNGIGHFKKINGENQLGRINLQILRKWNQIIFPQPKTTGCTCIYTSENRQVDRRQKFLFDDQQTMQKRRTEEKFMPVKMRSADTTHSEESSNQDTFSLKRVKYDTYSIQTTNSFCFARAEKDSSSNMSPVRENGQSEAETQEPKGLQLQNYHILSYEKEAPAENLTVLRSVYGILRGLFKNSIYIDDIKKLSPESFLVFSLICEKKFKININSLDDNLALEQLTDMVKNKTVHKRPEECKKIVFSYTIKQLKHRLRDRYTQQYRKTNFDEFFYQFYFEEISVHENILLEDFYYPIASTKCKKNSAKTINTAYLSNIRKSDKFMSDLKTYIYTQLIRDYTKEIDAKLLDLVTRWENEIKRAETLDGLKAALGSYFKGSKSKLPWTIFEVQHAIEKVRSVVY